MKRDLDHQLWKFIREHELKNKKLAVALSGGVDSVALLKALSKVHRNVVAVHVHHGWTSSKTQWAYREKAVRFCQKLCQSLDIELLIGAADTMRSKDRKPKSSEADLRALRYEIFGQTVNNHQVDFIVLGHHADDLLETRLLRLIRGTGAQGLACMKSADGVYLRPFLKTSKEDLKHYLKEEKLKFLDDPSNREVDPLRNWLRKAWISPLEIRQKGAVQTLARSLETLVIELSSHQNFPLEAFTKRGLSLAYYQTLTREDQRRLLAHYLFREGKKDFTQNHLEEIRKRLDTWQKGHSFRIASCNWTVNAQQIEIES